MRRYAARAQVEVDRGRVVGARFAPEIDGERVRDDARDLVVQREHVGLGAVEALGPELQSVGDADDARVDAEHAGHPLDRAFDDDLHVEIAADLSRVSLGVFVLRDDAARAHAQAARDAEEIDEIVGEAVGDVVVLAAPELRKGRTATRLSALARAGSNRGGGAVDCARVAVIVANAAATCAIDAGRSVRLARHAAQHELGEASRRVGPQRARIRRRREGGAPRRPRSATRPATGSRP